MGVVLSRKSFADPFTNADPSGTRIVHLADFAKALPARKALFKGIGCTATTLASLEETVLDDHYVMARATWRWEFDRPDRELTLASMYILRRTDAGLKIVWYQAHQDLMTILRSRGWLPSPSTQHPNPAPSAQNPAPRTVKEL